MSESTQPLAHTKSSAEIAIIAKQAALSVGPMLKAAFREQMKVDHKVDLHDPVTVYDRRAEDAIRLFLEKAIPGSTVIGEEDGGELATSDQLQWYVDPIDGTSNFAAGIAFWCISIGAVINGQIIAGAIYDPVGDQMFWADEAGAWLNGEPLRADSVQDEARATLITGYPVVRDFRLDGREVALDRFGDLAAAFSTLRRPGSAALSICHIAAGWADAAAGFGVNAWDVSAAILILRKAGGLYRPFRLGKQPLGAPDYACPGYMAIGPNVTYPTLDAVCEKIEKQRTKL